MSFPAAEKYTGVTENRLGAITGFGVVNAAGSLKPQPSDVTGATLGYDARSRFAAQAGTSSALGGPYETVQSISYQYGHPVSCGPTAAIYPATTCDVWGNGGIDPYTGAALLEGNIKADCNTGAAGWSQPTVTYE